MWPASAAELVRVQERLAAATPEPWKPPPGRPLVAGCFVCFGRGRSGRGRVGEPGWAGAVLMHSNRHVVGEATVCGEAAAAYEPGLLALREGPLLEAAVRALPERPEVLLVNATGRDHPRRAGLALHLGAILELPSVGVTDKPLTATGREPGHERGASSPLLLERVELARLLRTRTGVRPLVVHPGWRTDLATAVSVVLGSLRRARTPEPLRRARREARLARARNAA